MNRKSANDNIYWLLLQIMFRAKHRMQLLAEEHGLTVMQAHSLTTLKPNEPLPMNVLSTYFMCDASNITGIVDRLEAQNLVERRDDPKDRRVKMIALTSHGEALQRELLEQTASLEAERLKPLFTSDEQQELRRLLRKLIGIT